MFGSVALPPCRHFSHTHPYTPHHTPTLSATSRLRRACGLCGAQLEGDAEARNCLIYRGVFPLLAEPSASTDPSKLVTGAVLEQALNVGRELGLCMSGSSVVRTPPTPPTHTPIPHHPFSY